MSYILYNKQPFPPIVGFPITLFIQLLLCVDGMDIAIAKQMVKWYHRTCNNAIIIA